MVPRDIGVFEFGWIFAKNADKIDGGRGECVGDDEFPVGDDTFSEGASDAESVRVSSD